MKKLVLIIFILLIVANIIAQKNELFDSYGGNLSIKGKKTGWFHTEKLNNRWYFVTPEGNAFFSIGVTHSAETIGKRDELNNFSSKYENNEEQLSKFFLSCFKSWGYNSSGYGVLPTMKKFLPYVADVWTESPRSHTANTVSINRDIFDPKIKNELKFVIAKKVSENIGNRNCIGYVGIDLPIWSVIPQKGKSYVDFMRTLPKNAYGKKKYIHFIEKKYKNNIKALNRAYGINLYSFLELNDSVVCGKIKAIDNSKVAADDAEFLIQIADEYFNFVSSTFHKLDPNHLYMGDRFMLATEPGLQTPDHILQTAAKYIKIISFQPMGPTTMWKEYLNHAAQITGKPILLADVNTMVSRPVKDQADTEEYERLAGENTIKYYMNVTDCNSVVGIHRCTVRDFRSWDTNFHRRGLLKVDDTPYSLLVEYTRKTNEMVFQKVY